MPFDDCGGGGGPPPLIRRLNPEECRIEARSEERMRFECGHEAPRNYFLLLKCDHEELSCAINTMSERFRERCGDCVREEVLRTATRCQSCGRPILLGSQVSTVRGDIMRCIAHGCATGMELTGHWNGDGIKPISLAIMGSPSCGFEF